MVFTSSSKTGGPLRDEKENWRVGHENAKRTDHFFLNMFRVWRTQRHIRTQTSLKCVTVYLQSSTSEPKIKYLCGKRGSLLDPSLLFLSQKQFALHFAGCTDWFTKQGGQADIYNISYQKLKLYTRKNTCRKAKHGESVTFRKSNNYRKIEFYGDAYMYSSSIPTGKCLHL